MTLFESFGLKPDIMKALEEKGFTVPTPIQEKAIPALLEKETDMIALAQTGTGKTAAFGLPLLQKANFETRKIQALVLCPTRELCMQTFEEMKLFSKYIPNAFITAIYGGTSIQQQIRDLKRGVHIIIATPGRLMDVIERGLVDFTSLTTVVLDEADEMLNMGFKEDIVSILSHTPDNKNTWLFSATMPNEIRGIVKQFMEKPVEIKAGGENKTAVNIHHHYYVVRSHEKYNALKRIVDFHPDIYGLIFCRTKAETQEIAEHLIKDGYNADSLHGDLSQPQRDTVMKRFREKSLQILVATDVAARGIDVNDISHVIQYTLPDDTEVYTHRSGRTARAGKTGDSIVLITPRESFRIRELERLTGSRFKASLVPTGYQVCEAQMMHIIDSMIKTPVNEQEIAPFMSIITEKLGDISREELVKRVASIEFNRFLNYYKDAPNLNYNSEEKRVNNTVRFFIGVGTMDGLEKTDLIKLIASVSGLQFAEVRRVEIERSFSFFETDKNHSEKVLKSFVNFKHNGRTVRVEITEKKADRERNREGGGKREGFVKREGYGKREGGESRGGGGRRERGSYGSDKPRSGGSGFKKRR